MAQCRTCGSSDYLLLDGTYFCSVCQTASEDIREEAAVDEILPSSQTQRTIRIRHKSGNETEKKGKDFGIKWTTIDAFNIIIKELVDILIKLGISPQIKPVVQNIWFRFLKNTQYAFCKSYSDKEWTPKFPPFPRERDVQAIHRNAIQIIAKKFRSTYIKNHKSHLSCNKKKLEQRLVSRLHRRRLNRQKPKNSKERKKEQIDVEIVNKNNDCNENINNMHILENGRLAGGDTDVPNCIEITNKTDESEYKKPKTVTKRSCYNVIETRFKKQGKDFKTHFCIQRLTMTRIVEFLFLGLLLVEKRVLLCDLLRWIKEGLIPINDAARFLPDEMKFQTYDTITYRLQYQPSDSQIRENTLKLAKFLDIRTIPSKNLLEIAARFILELNLPAQFHQLVYNLYVINPPAMQARPTTSRLPGLVPNYEGRALAFIIVIMKLVLGLDGKTERKQTKFGKKIAEVLEGENPFIWDDWVTFVNGRRFMINMHSFSLDDNFSRYLKDPLDIIKSHELALKSRGKRCESSYKKRSFLRENVRNPLREPLKALNEESELEQIQTRFTSFPVSSKAREILSKLDDVPEDALQDFRRTSLQCYITPGTLKERLHEKGFLLIIKKISALSQHRKKTKTNDASLQDSPLATTRSRNLAKLKVYQPCREYNICHYWKNAFLFNKYISKVIAPSLCWLITICSEIGHMSSEALYREIILVERVLLEHSVTSKLKKYSRTLLNCW